jgi:hypothetical protein
MNLPQPTPPPKGLPNDVAIAYTIALLVFTEVTRQLQFKEVRKKHYPLNSLYLFDNFANSVSLSIVGLLLCCYGDEQYKNQPIHKIINLVIADFALNGVNMRFKAQDPCEELSDEKVFDNFAKYVYLLLRDIQHIMLSRGDIYSNLEIPEDEIRKGSAGIWINIVFGREISFLGQGIDINRTILKDIATDKDRPILPEPCEPDLYGDWPVPPEPVAKSDTDEDEPPISSLH